MYLCAFFSEKPKRLVNPAIGSEAFATSCKHHMDFDWWHQFWIYLNLIYLSVFSCLWLKIDSYLLLNLFFSILLYIASSTTKYSWFTVWYIQQVVEPCNCVSHDCLCALSRVNFILFLLSHDPFEEKKEKMKREISGSCDSSALIPPMLFLFFFFFNLSGMASTMLHFSS